MHSLPTSRRAVIGSMLAAPLALRALPSLAAGAPSGQIVVAWHVTISPSWFDPSTAPPQITPFGMLYALHDALVRAFADAVFLVVGMHTKIQRATVHPRQLGVCLDAHAHRRRRHVCDVEVNADGLMAGRQKPFDRLERRSLHQVDHDRRGKHAHAAAADMRRGVLLAHHDFNRSA